MQMVISNPRCTPEAPPTHTFALEPGHEHEFGTKKYHGNDILQIKPGTAKMESENKSLEVALLDQRMRADKHKTNFESLKAQHLNLQEVSETVGISQNRENFIFLASLGYPRLHQSNVDRLHPFVSAWMGTQSHKLCMRNCCIGYSAVSFQIFSCHPVYNFHADSH